jgi:hypothetical protein
MDELYARYFTTDIVSAARAIRTLLFGVHDIRFLGGGNGSIGALDLLAYEHDCGLHEAFILVLEDGDSFTRLEIVLYQDIGFLFL